MLKYELCSCCGYCEIVVEVKMMNYSGGDYWLGVAVGPGNILAKKSFKYLKDCFTMEPIFYKLNPALPYILESDTYSVITSGILSQKNSNTRELYPIIYYFKKLFLAKLNYITQDQELFIIIFYFKHWRYYLKEALYSIIIYTNLNNLYNVIITVEHS